MNVHTTIFSNGKDIIELTLLDKPLEQKLGGMVSSELFEENIAIVIEDNPRTVEYDFACLAYAKDKTVPRVMIKSEFCEDLKKKTKESETILFHELGHYVNNDIATNDGNEDDERENLVANNMVSRKEINADAFAVQYLGIDCVVKGLSDLRGRILAEYAD